jgi:hypothetical protein
MSIRVLVCGGRDYNDRDHIHNTLCEIEATRGPISCVIHGAATGADHEGMIWAQMISIRAAPRRATSGRSAMGSWCGTHSAMG